MKLFRSLDLVMIVFESSFFLKNSFDFLACTYMLDEHVYSDIHFWKTLSLLTLTSSESLSRKPSLNKLFEKCLSDL